MAQGPPDFWRLGLGRLDPKLVVSVLIISSLTLVLGASGVGGTDFNCTLCVGIRVDNGSVVAGEFFSELNSAAETSIFVAFPLELDGSSSPTIADAVRRTGARLWVRAVFRTPQPIAEHLSRLETELEELAQFVREGGAGIFVEAVWQPEEGQPGPVDLAFLIKKAAVAVTGASADAVFTAGPLNTDPEYLRRFYQEEVAAYLDLVTLAPGGDLRAVVATLAELDPGKPLVLDALSWPATAAETLTRVAEASSTGIAVTFFDLQEMKDVDLVPFKVLAREFSGNLVFDPDATPRSAGQAWSFMREDLDLRVVAVPPDPTGVFELIFADSQLRSPTLVDLADGQDRSLYDTARNAHGLTVRVHDPGEVVLLRLKRPSAEELAGFDDTYDVSGERQIPVEEILRRLQAFEDDQARRIEHYQATRTLHLRFQAVQGAFDVSYAGDFFFRKDKGFDWVWKDFFVGGVKWRSKKLPKVPLIQPEKAASLPTEIRLTKDYGYNLRGTSTVDGRDCWVIDFKPIGAVPGRSLFRGTVWVDREIFARVRMRAVQIGLEGSVLSNEETRFYSPLDVSGQLSDWSIDSFVLPTRISGQRNLSVLSVTLPVEQEIVLTDIRINGTDFQRQRDAALASDLTMVRDTSEGVRYLRKDESGQRVVETEVDSTRLFLLGGVFWDETVDFPLPLAGVNYLDLDFMDFGTQFDIFFAGALLNVGYSDPRLFGSRWNGGANLNGIFFKATDELYRDGVVVSEEDVRSWSSSADIFVGRPLGDYLSLELTYGLRKIDYSRAEETADDFVMPQDTLTQTLKARIQYNRAGYRMGLSADTNSRSDWDFWGLPGNGEYHPDQQEFQRWRAVFAKTWWLPKFRKIGLTVEHLDGSNLDRFSGYDFGLLGNSVVAGYPSGLVRAEKANGAHLSYGINFFEVIRFDVRGDAVWASNQSTGLENELLAGIGVEGTLTLPWQLIMNFEAGYAVAGPGKGGVALRVFFLRLFPGK